MLNGSLTSEWHYRKPISDRILLWWWKGLRSPLLWLYNATGRSSRTLQRWESTLWSRGAKHMRTQNIVYFDISEGGEMTFSTSSLGTKRITLSIATSLNTYSAGTKKRGLGWNPGGANTQGEK